MTVKRGVLVAARGSSKTRTEIDQIFQNWEDLQKVIPAPIINIVDPMPFKRSATYTTTQLKDELRRRGLDI